jgi:hypothetical protein
MVDNLFLGPEAGINHSLALLRADTFEKPVDPRVELGPNVFFSVDPDASVSGGISSTPGTLLALHLTPHSPTRWISVHFQLGGSDLRQVQMLGLICRSQAPKAVTYKITLRSGVAGGFVDTMFRKTGVAYAEASVHLDLIDLSRDLSVPREAPWREIIVNFDTSAIDVTLLNFGVFSI